MASKQQKRSGKDRRCNDLASYPGKERRRYIDPRLPVIFEEEMSDHYWGTSDTYYETYFNIPLRE